MLNNIVNGPNSLERTFIAKQQKQHKREAKKMNKRPTIHRIETGPPRRIQAKTNQIKDIRTMPPFQQLAKARAHFLSK